MYPRWHPDEPGHPHPPENGGLGLSRPDYFAEALPDLEQQLTAMLGGASWAAVSFVTEDAAWCDWIYHALNGYPLPASLVDRVTPHGFPRPDCLSIFPDRQDPDYHEHIAQALENSAFLVVVCSSHSAHHAVVDEHIRAFKNAGGDERIIALVIDGLPDERLGEHPRVENYEWLPAWLRWRCDEKGFCPADRSEPRIVDARRGHASLRQVRDALLTALVDMDSGELDRLGGFNRPLPEIQSLPTVHQTPMPKSLSPDFSVRTPEPGSRRDATFMIGTAVALIILATIFGVKSFRELSADEPQSALAGIKRTTPMLARNIAPVPAINPEPAPIVELETAPAAMPPVIVASAAPALADKPVAVPMIEPPVAPRANVPQWSPSQIFATTRVQPEAVVSPLRAVVTSTPSSFSTTSDSVLLDEVATLERRGDEIMAEKRVEDALDLYSTALGSAQEYAARKGANPAAKDQVVMLMRKLALLQVQNASTAEARTTYQQARRTLLQLKTQGGWTRERAKQLDEMESRLLSLPRD